MFRKSLALAGALGLIAGGAQATPEAATYTLQISGIVPTVCNANLDSSTVASEAGEVALGQLKEFCNDSAGYQVWVDYSPNLAGDTRTQHRLQDGAAGRAAERRLGHGLAARRHAVGVDLAPSAASIVQAATEGFNRRAR